MIIKNDIIKVELHIVWHVSIHGWFKKILPPCFFCKTIITIIIFYKFYAFVIGVPIIAILKPPLQGI